MIDIENYISKLIDFLHYQFGARLLYVGLQGSYLRGEQTDSSDIDIMVVIDGLRVSDLDHYRAIIMSLEEPDKSCGFICSRSDLANWNPLEICHLLNCTKDYYGVLKQLVSAYTEGDIRNYVKMSINNLYHEICHGYIHSEESKNAARLPDAYKCAFFILQDLYYLENGEYIPTKVQLLPLLSGQNRDVLERSIQLNDGIAHDFSESFELLFTWCQNTLKAL